MSTRSAPLSPGGSGLEIEWLDTFYAGRPRAYAHVYLGRAVRS